MYEKLMEVLARSEVKELALQTDRPACVLVGEQYQPIMNRNLTEEEIIGAAIEAGGRTEVLHLLSEPRRWDYQHPTLGTLRISAGYHGALLQVRMKLIVPAPRPAPSAQVGSSAGVPKDRITPEPPMRKAFSAPQSMRAPEPPRLRPDPSDFGEMPPLMGPQARAAGPSMAPASAPLNAKRFAPPERPKPKSALSDLFSEPPPLPPEGPQDAPELTDAGLDDLSEQTIPSPVSEPPAFRLSLEEGPTAALEALLERARELKASDIHILADRPPMLRIGGELIPQGDALPADFVEKMLLPVVPSRVRGDLDQHGSCDFALNHETLGRFRCNVTRQRTGYKLTARPIGDRVPTLAELGLPDSISLATQHHQGLIVVTGPTGHGKTTTLAAIVDIINSTRNHHIITVEDPVEYVHPRKMAMMSQREVGTHTKTFFSALKGSLREDPDVIVVGELRDTETVRMALSASETGHLVISTMNTPSAAKAIERIIDLFPPGDQPQVRMTLAGGLRLVVSQRLVPTADGKGMAAAVELLPGSSALWALIRDNKTFQIPSLQQRGKALGIIRLDDSLAELVRSGRVTLEAAKEYAENPDQLEALVTGKNPRAGEAPLSATSIDPTKEAAQAAQKFGKEMLSKAGRLFGDKK